MISACISVYNHNVNRLVDEISKQAGKAGITLEIILIDDRSSGFYRTVNREASKEHQYILLEENVGRSKIRNLFPDYARYGKLLFLDCDSVIVADDFLQRYIDEIPKGAKVICGGLVNDTDVPSPDRRLRWKYGVSREGQNALVRKKDPFRFFRTNNFLIDREVLEQIKFTEDISGYGHEDTFYAFQLRKANIMINHIDNPVLHFNDEENMQFLKKTGEAVSNLVRLMEITGNDKDFIRQVRLLRVHRIARDLYLEWLIRFLFDLAGPLVRVLLSGRFSSLVLLDFYKLGYLSKITQGKIHSGRPPEEEPARK